MSRAPYIVIAGNIGAGKSSMTEWLAHHYAVDVAPEPNDANPFLEAFYADMPRWAFHSQIWFLTRKIPLHRAFAHSPRALVQDRSIWEDAEIFAEHLGRSGVLSADEHRTYRALYDELRADLRPPDLLVYLRCPVRVLRRRIAARGRAMEASIDPRYLRALHRLYEAFHEDYTLGPKVVLETATVDPVTNLLDRHDVLDAFDALLPRRAT
ncbi:MAG: deoxynucleoside kinase [Deltaproteobacteria bacterium]|nr:MAG: deoxynucleoside kinase [Deltaproteobacteria bacterium]